MNTNKMKRECYEMIARCAMAVRLQEQECSGSSVVGPGSPSEKLEHLRLNRDACLDNCAKLFPGGLREAMEPIMTDDLEKLQATASEFLSVTDWNSTPEGRALDALLPRGKEEEEEEEEEEEDERK